MSCLGNTYNPNPPNVWSRVRTTCDYNDPDNMKHKANILQYKNNSSCLTKQQRYSKIAQGTWTEQKTSWASQSQTYTNSNQGIPIFCPNRVICLPSSNSGVPGKNVPLCAQRRAIQPYYTRRRTTMSTSGSNFPDGFKFI
jgi:hypothetical protein